MVSVPVVNMQGESRGTIEIDPKVLGGEVRPRLIKQAVVTYLDHQRQRSARTKGRGDVEGSTKKLYRQKGTGNARVGAIRTVVRRGGGQAFGQRIPRRSKDFPRKMRRLACRNALLAKIQDSEVVVVEGLSYAEPKTKSFVSMLRAIGADNGCLMALHEPDRNILLSGRNVSKVAIRLVSDLTAYEVLQGRKVVFSKQAFENYTSVGSGDQQEQ